MDFNEIEQQLFDAELKKYQAEDYEYLEFINDYILLEMLHKYYAIPEFRDWALDRDIWDSQFVALLELDPEI